MCFLFWMSSNTFSLYEYHMQLHTTSCDSACTVIPHLKINQSTHTVPFIASTIYLIVFFSSSSVAASFAFFNYNFSFPFVRTPNLLTQTINTKYLCIQQSFSIHLLLREVETQFALGNFEFYQMNWWESDKCVWICFIFLKQLIWRIFAKPLECCNFHFIRSYHLFDAKTILRISFFFSTHFMCVIIRLNLNIHWRRTRQILFGHSIGHAFIVFVASMFRDIHSNSKHILAKMKCTTEKQFLNMHINVRSLVKKILVQMTLSSFLNTESKIRFVAILAKIDWNPEAVRKRIDCHRIVLNNEAHKSFECVCVCVVCEIDLATCLLSAFTMSYWNIFMYLPNRVVPELGHATWKPSQNTRLARQSLYYIYTSRTLPGEYTTLNRLEVDSESLFLFSLCPFNSCFLCYGCQTLLTQYQFLQSDSVSVS